MKQLMIKPTIYKYDTCKKFAEEFHIEKVILLSQTNISMSHSSGS